MTTLRSALALAVLAGCAVPPHSPLSRTRPNIVFVFSDDHAAHAISAYGSVINETPNIDRLAREGMMFRNCFCGNSICGPSRATILTGLHCHSNGFMRNGNKFDGGQTTFPKLLQRAGYQTALIGKWHLTSDPTGFDHWMVLPGQGQYYNPDFITPEGRVRIEGYCTDITTDLALDWLREGRDADKPFVLMCQHKAPHRSWMPGPEELGLYRDHDIPEPATLFDDWSGQGPAAQVQEMTVARDLYLHYDLKVLPTEDEQRALEGPDRWWKGMRDRLTQEQLAAWDAAFESENRAFREANLGSDARVRWMYQRYIKNYLRCVAGVDKSVGRILEFIDADPELRANTIVIYSSDQGFYLGDRGWYDKRWMYEESLRMPLLVRWPGKIGPGIEHEALVQNIDFAPTFLELAGVEPPPMHGESLVPLLEGRVPSDWRDAIYYHYYESHAVHEVAAHFGVRTATHKLIRFYEPMWGYSELYDLVADPAERLSVYGDPAYATVQRQLERKLTALRRQYADTTGRLDGGFDFTAGVASIEETGAGLRVWCNAVDGFALRYAEEPVSTIGATVSPADAAAPGDACVVLAFGPARRQTIRAGIDFASGRLSVRQGRTELAGADLEIDGDPVALRVAIDEKARRIEATAGSATVSVEIPPAWARLSATGYGSSNSSAVFGPIE